MSFSDADLYNGFSFGYDEFPSYTVPGDDGTDVDLLYSNRANKLGEINDHLYPISNFRGGYEIPGNGPQVSYATQRNLPYLPREPSTPGVKTSYMTIGDMANEKVIHQPDLQPFPLQRKTNENFINGGFLLNQQTFLIILIVVLLCVVFLQYFQIRNIMQSFYLFMSLDNLKSKPQPEPKPQPKLESPPVKPEPTSEQKLLETSKKNRRN